ncbi:MAG: Flp pilus assembly complex ATPase component TadA [Phycisphaerales bacterium]|nr:Flp pilus assembly complex ATPase component TadA [Phycisphaerales bacterium]
MPDLHLFLSDISVFLLSPWKPLVIWGVVAWWAWLVAAKIQPDAKFYRFNVERWNLAHLLCALVGIGIMIFGWMFYVGWPVGVLVMFAPTLVYWKIRNANVPETARYAISFTRSPEARQQKAAQKALRDVTLSYTDSSKESVAIPSQEDPARAIFLSLESILAPAMEARANRVDLLLGSGGCLATQTVDTIRTKVDTLDTESGAKVFNLVRTMAGMDLSESRRRQIGEFQVSSGGSHHRLTATTSGTSKGQVLRIDFDRAQQVRIPYDGLGLLKNQRAVLDPLVKEENRHGIVLLSSPTGMGLTTTGYALMSIHDSYTSNVRSLEREVEAEMEGAVQQVWDATDPQVDFAKMLQSMLRRDPDVIFVAGVQDADTAKTAAASGADGPLLYLSMNAGSTPATLTQWLQHVGDTSLAGNPLRAIVHQRLMRRLCDNCKVGFVPTDAGRFRLPEGTELYRAGGKIQDRNKILECPVCRGSGYLGAIGVFEVTPISEDARMHIVKGDLQAALTAARREKTPNIQEAALKKAVAGETSLEEIGRVLSPKKKTTAPKEPSGTSKA